MDSETAEKLVRSNARWFFIMLFIFLALVALAAYLLGMRAGAKEAKAEMRIRHLLIVPEACEPAAFGQEAVPLPAGILSL